MTILLTRPVLPVVDDISRRGLLTGLGLTGLLTACGTGVTTPRDAPAGRVVETPRGAVTIPTDPQRVLTVYTHDLANALVLGLPVIAGPGESGQPGAEFPDYLVEAFPEQVAALTRIAYQPEPNIEQIAALAPDVILAGIFGSGTDEPVYDRFAAIAPTVTYLYSEGEEYTIRPWRTVLRENADAFDRRPAAEEWITRFEERAATLRDRLAARWAGATWAMLFPETGEFYLYGPTGGHIPATLIDELGLPVAGSVERLLGEGGLEQGGAAVTYERIGEIDADIVYVTSSVGADGAADRAGVDALAAQPLWPSVPAVAAGQVHQFRGDIFYESGPMATAFLDVVERTLLT